jgi:hypothetical protein
MVETVSAGKRNLAPGFLSDHAPAVDRPCVVTRRNLSWGMIPDGTRPQGGGDSSPFGP